MQQKNIDELRHYSYKMVQELSILQIDKDDEKFNPRNWHALIEVEKNPKITISQLANKLVLHISTVSRLVDNLIREDLIEEYFLLDKREKFLKISKKASQKMKKIDEFSNSKIINAFRFLGKKDQEEIISAIKKYATALEKSRLENDLQKIKIRVISTSRTLRLQVKNMVENIQKNEFQIAIDDQINASILKIEEYFYYNNSCNFFYAFDEKSQIIGCVGLKKIDKNYGEIKNFFVVKEYRGKKVGQALMEKLLAAAKKHQFSYLCLGTIDVLKSAQNFYIKSGFKKISPKLLPQNFLKCKFDNLFFIAKVGDVDFENLG